MPDEPESEADEDVDVAPSDDVAPDDSSDAPDRPDGENATADDTDATTDDPDRDRDVVDTGAGTDVEGSPADTAGESDPDSSQGPTISADVEHGGSERDDATETETETDPETATATGTGGDPDPDAVAAAGDGPPAAAPDRDGDSASASGGGEGDDPAGGDGDGDGDDDPSLTGHDEVATPPVVAPDDGDGDGDSTPGDDPYPRTDDEVTTEFDAHPATGDDTTDGADDGADRDGPEALAGYDPAEDDVVATDGEGATVDATTPTLEDDPDYDYGYLDDGIDGPEDDVEMPLTDHIEEMIRRLAVVFFVGGLVTLFLFPGADAANAYLATDLPTATDVINHLWDKHIPGTETNPERRPRLYGPLELVLTELKVAGLGGLVFGLPALVYESYLFMRPGLYPKERRYYLAAVPTSVVLAAIGVAFAHFAVLPAIFAYFTSYTTGTAVVAFGLKETFNLILILMGYMAIVFQIPLFIMLAIMMDLVTSQWLRERRLLFWGAFLGVSFIATPDPTGMAPIIVGATMIVLFEGTLGVLRYTRH
jgi:sec-independent protein translocase protein TatC